MGMKTLFTYLLLFLIPFISISQEKISEVKFDSLISYEVKKKETLYSISKNFNVNINDIISYNPELLNNKLRKKSIIIIPLKKIIKANIGIKNINSLSKVDSTKQVNEFKIKKNYIKIAYLAPFKLNSIELDSINKVNDFLKNINLTTISISFYNGILMAADEISKNDVNIDIDVFDTDNKIERIEKLRLNNDFDQYDLIVGPLINRNFNIFFNSETKTNSISPLAYEDIIIKSNTIIPHAVDSLKRDKMFKIIDELITANPDQCAMIISDSLNIKSRNNLLKRFPLAEVIDLSKINNSVDPKITDSLMSINKENWVFLETKKPNIISSVTSLLNSQINNERKIKLFSTVSNENYDNPNINYEKLGNLNFTYPSNSIPDSGPRFIDFQNKFLVKFGRFPDRISIKSYDMLNDLFFRIATSKSLKNSIDIGETRLLQNKFNYKYNAKSGYQNTSFFILRHEDLDIIDY